MTPRRNSNPNTIRIRRKITRSCIGWSLVLGLIQLEANLREIVEFRDRRALNLGFDTALEDAVEECVDVRLFGEVDERFGVIRGLHFFEILDDFLCSVRNCDR